MAFLDPITAEQDELLTKLILIPVFFSLVGSSLVLGRNVFGKRYKSQNGRFLIGLSGSTLLVACNDSLGLYADTLQSGGPLCKFQVCIFFANYFYFHSLF